MIYGDGVSHSDAESPTQRGNVETARHPVAFNLWERVVTAAGKSGGVCQPHREGNECRQMVESV